MESFLEEWNNDSPYVEVKTSGSTGEPKRMTREEFDQWQADCAVVVFSLPRTGKNIIATVYSVKGKEEREFVWDGYRFHLAK